jgi:hypothetical protein
MSYYKPFCADRNGIISQIFLSQSLLGKGNISDLYEIYEMDKMTFDIAARGDPKPAPTHRSVKHKESRLEPHPQTKGSNSTEGKDSDNNGKNERNGIKG